MIRGVIKKRRCDVAKGKVNFTGKKSKSATKTKKSAKGKGTKSSGKSNAWRAYTGGGISNAPIPD
jgi:hypothetical protein